MNFLALLVILAVSSGNVFSQSIEDFKISSIISLIESKKMTCTEITKYFIERSVKYNPSIRAIISYDPNALKIANQLDEHFNSKGKIIGRLHCVPFLIKDNIDIKNVPTTGGVIALRNLIPNKSSSVIDKLLSEGAVVIAKANLGELAFGVRYESETGGECVNPFDHTRTCGASSSGSAAGISAGMGVVSLGTDTGGSIFGPSTYNGVFGLRSPANYPPKDGIIPVSEIQDTVGPLAKHLDDLVLTYSVINSDPALYDNYLKPTKADQLRLRIITNFMSPFTFGSFDYTVQSTISPLIKNAWDSFKNLGLNISEITLTNEQLGKIMSINNQMEQPAIAAIVACYKSAINAYLKDPVRYESDSPYKDFKDLEQSPLLSELWKQQLQAIQVFYPPGVDEKDVCRSGSAVYTRLRTQFTEAVMEYFTDDIDALLIPSLTSEVPLLNGTGSLSMGFLSVYTGMGLLTVPSGFTPPTKDSPDGLPFAMALIGKAEKMKNLYKIAKLYENKFSYVKLPHTTPLLENKENKCLKNTSTNLSYKYCLTVFIFNMFFTYLLKIKISN